MTSTTVWHLGHAVDHRRVNGVSAVVWSVAAAQARLGARVVLVNRRPLTEEASAHARDAGVEERTLPPRGMGFEPGSVERALRSEPPDVVHLHSVFLPHQAVFARALRARAIPYVVTPHGGLSPHVLARGRLKKWWYAALVERRRFEDAAAVTALTPGEVREVRAFAPRFVGAIPVVPNPVDVRLLESTSPQVRGNRPVVTFLGRFDVLHKGIDRLYRLAELVPEADFHLYGTGHDPTRAWLAELDRRRPANLERRAPVFGDAKVAALLASTLYIQMSRWEGFPVSVAEAMALGVPVAVSEELHFAPIIESAEAGVLLGADPERAAAQLRAALAQPERMQALGRHGRRYARAHFHPESVARTYLAAYADACSSVGTALSNAR